MLMIENQNSEAQREQIDGLAGQRSHGSGPPVPHSQCGQAADIIHLPVTGPRGCWESGRQLPVSDNRRCILILRQRTLERAAPLLPHHPARKTINPAIREESTELSWATAGAESYQLPSCTSRNSEQPTLCMNST
ncbi:hypothetical protein INR49_011478 [Caranx melampygus]|nr:hypothetical protein INR49_011478 [Caranx melampygus]